MHNAHTSAKKRGVASVVSLVLVVAWCIFIFYMSSRVSSDSDNMSLGFAHQVLQLFLPGFGNMSASEQAALLQSLNYPVRKLAHFSEYTVLGILALNALQQLKKSRAHIPLWLISWLFCVFYAATDEFHQLFVPGRSCLFTDVCIDSAGALLGTALLLLALRLYQHMQSSSQKQ